VWFVGRSHEVSVVAGERERAHGSAEHAEAPSKSDLDRSRPGVRALQAIANPTTPPSDIAKLVAQHPDERDSMIAYLQQTAGNAYAQRVLAAMPATCGHESDSSSVVDLLAKLRMEAAPGGARVPAAAVAHASPDPARAAVSENSDVIKRGSKLA